MTHEEFEKLDVNNEEEIKNHFIGFITELRHQNGFLVESAEAEEIKQYSAAIARALKNHNNRGEIYYSAEKCSKDFDEELEKAFDEFGI